MIIYFNTVKRKRPVRDGGELVQMDWSSKKVLKTVPLYPFEPDILDDPNPRGNSRGGKGMLICGEELFVGTYHSILVFDFDLVLKRKISNPLFVNIHEIDRDGENIWVSSTAIDVALLVNRDGVTIKSWWPREEPLLQDRYGLSPMDINKNIDNRLVHLNKQISTQPHHTHLNSVVKFRGNTYALLNKFGAFVQIEPEVKVILEDSALKGAHSPMISNDGAFLIVYSSFRKNIVVYDLATGRILHQIDLMSFTEIANLCEAHPDQPFNQSIFVRGLKILDESRILVGISPASILEIDWHRHHLLDMVQYSHDVGDAVHGLPHLE